MSAAPKVPLSKIHESPDNPRQLFGNLSELAESIKSQGVLQNLVARETTEGLELVFGHRRFRAAKMAGLKEVPVEVREYTRQQAIEAMVAENAHREDVNPIELAESFAKMMNDFGLSAEEVADRVSLKRATVFNVITLNRLIEPVKKALLSEKIGASAGYTIARVRDPRLQAQALDDVLKLAKDGEQPPARAVTRLIQDKYLHQAKAGVSKRQREKRELGEEVALRKRALERLRVRVAELVERRAHLDDGDLRVIALAMAETGNEAVVSVFQRRGLRSDRLSKVAGAQLRSLIVEAAVAPWATLANGEYSPAARALAKAYGLSLSEIEKAVAASENAEALFKKV